MKTPIAAAVRVTGRSQQFALTFDGQPTRDEERFKRIRISFLNECLGTAEPPGLKSRGPG